MTPRSVNRIITSLLALIGFGLVTLAAPVPATTRVDFNFQIRPLLSDRCFRCHGPDSAARKAKLRLDQREGALTLLEDGMAVVKPGDPEHSELIRRIVTQNEDDIMPPPDSHLTLTPAEKELLKRWVLEGADYKPHWAFLPVQKVAVPRLKNGTVPFNPIDAFVRERLEKERLSPAPPASRETILRRLAFNLTGLPPAPADIDALLADKSPDAIQRAAQKYMNSPAYGERMALDWLDLARYADTYGYQGDVERDVSPYRDWVIKAFNENLSYDTFLTWQIAGDLLPNATREQRIATAFNRLHRQTNEGGSVEEEFRVEYCADRVNTFATSVLGLTMECARCHDHKFDPIKQKEYFSLLAFFNSIDESGLYSHFTSATPTPTQMLWPGDKEKQHAELKAKIAVAETQLAKVATSASGQYELWLKRAAVSSPAPIAHFAFDAITNNATADSASTNVAKLEESPMLVVVGNSPAATNSALKFSGDNAVVCSKVKSFLRTDSFSFNIRIKPEQRADRAVIFHQSKAWTDAGSRGFELTLDHGKPFFGLIHFWPGNAVAVRSKSALPTNVWSEITVTYDGSSRASGICLYLNGAALATEVVRDHLYKDISYAGAWKDRYSGNDALKLAARMRDSGFKNGLIDDLKVFDLALTPAEVAGLSGNSNDQISAALSITNAGLRMEALSTNQTLFDYYLARHDAPYKDALAELKRLRDEENKLSFDVPEIMTMEEMAQPRVTHRLNRGAYDAPAEVVERGTPDWLPPFPKDQPRNRLGLARWTVARKNPLTARVAVNRIWRMHFGRGLVATQDDFGSQGKLPTHPELLDWLAGWFMDNGWNVKALHKLIVSSDTFQQSAQTKRAIIERDPENRLLTRAPKIRLPAEHIRDSALAASGLLSRKVGGPSVKPYQPVGLWEAAGTGKSYKADHGENLYRRSLYTFWRRTSPPPSMLTFDAMSREVCTAKRETTATPLQSLVLLNDPQFVEAARVLGEKLLKKFPTNEGARIREAFRALTGRAPDKAETKILAQLLTEQRENFTFDTDGAKKLLAIGESEPDSTLPPAEFAAMTTLVSAIMNFDEFVVER